MTGHLVLVDETSPYRMLSLDSISCLQRLVPIPVTGTTRTSSVGFFKSHFCDTRSIIGAAPNIRGIRVK